MTRCSKLKPSDNVFIDNNLEQRKKYECPECCNLLRDAVQISCGHWLCLECAKTLFKDNSNPTCPRIECGDLLEIEDGKEYFPDKFVRREISKFLVRCRYYRNSCEWTGPLVEQLKHIETCIYEQEECMYCHEDFDKAKMTRAECDKHLEADVARHLKMVVPELRRLSLDKKEMEKSIKEIKMQRPPPGVTKSVKRSSPLEEGDRRWDIKSFAECTGTPEPYRVPSDDLDYYQETDDLKGVCSGRYPHDSTIVSNASPVFSPEFDSLKNQLASKDSQIRHLQDKLLQVEATVPAETTENEDRDFRLSLMENSNYDGTMLWKIPQFTQRMEDARTGKYTSIFSLPFHSGRYGYKMCLRLYILGDGIGKASHMSLFFVLMKGEFDNILQWPFNHKVTFKLINQCSRRDVVDIFKPDPLSSSFQKPKRDMNIASGCPRFVSLNELMQNGFIVDDTIFIKVKVDTTTMKHT